MPIRAFPTPSEAGALTCRLLSTAVVSFGIAFPSEDRSFPPRVIPMK